MTHWLEEAEKEKLQEPKKHKVSRTIIQQKADDIKKNYEANKDAYDDFIQSLFVLCQRANNLPPGARDPWGIIEAKAKKSKMDSHLVSFLTRERFDMRVPTKSFPFMKLKHYKHIRQVMFSISKEMGMTNVEVYEDFVTKRRLNKDDGNQEKDIVDDGLDRMHIVYHYSIKELEEGLALKILDFLVFKKDAEHLPFTKKDIKRIGRTRSTM
jgi:hypothetical protein